MLRKTVATILLITAFATAVGMVPALVENVVYACDREDC